MAAHKFRPGDYVRERSSPYVPGRVYEVHSVTATGLPRVAYMTGGDPEVLRDGRRARVRLRLKASAGTPTDDTRDAAACEWLTYRGWTVTPPVAKEAT